MRAAVIHAIAHNKIPHIAKAGKIRFCACNALIDSHGNQHGAGTLFKKQGFGFLDGRAAIEHAIDQQHRLAAHRIGWTGQNFHRPARAARAV